MLNYQRALQSSTELDNRDDDQPKAKRVRKATNKMQESKDSGLLINIPAIIEVILPASNLPIEPDCNDEKYQPQPIQEVACPLYDSSFESKSEDLPDEDDLNN